MFSLQQIHDMYLELLRTEFDVTLENNDELTEGEAQTIAERRAREYIEAELTDAINTFRMSPRGE